MTDSLSDSLAFDPVPSACRRRDGWTPERQHAFILALAQLGLIGAAARSVGMSRKSAYALLKRAGPDSSFARAWDAAIAGGRAQARDLGIERAVHGVQIPYFYRGIQRGTQTVYDDRLLIAALRAVGRARGEDDSPPSPADDLAVIQRFVEDSP